SEVGHLNIGAGRIVYQDFAKINKAVEDKTIDNHPVILEAFNHAKENNVAVHFIGLVSDGGIHSHQNHLYRLCEMANQHQIKNGYIHAFTDGRDCDPKSGLGFLKELEKRVENTNCQIASVVGRYYAMDRDNRWERVEQAYRLMTEGVAERTAATAMAGLEAAYAAGESDEFVKATAIIGEGEQAALIKDGDAIVFMNFRADRAREISRAFVDNEFTGFERRIRPQLAEFVMLTQYSASIKAPVAYKPENLNNSLGEYLANLGKTQLRIAETEKYAHVTFFFSGGREELFAGEQRILVPSPKVATYDLQPEMSAYEVTDKLVAAIKSGEFDALICNYANGDMVGHTGVFDAAVKAVEALDVCLGRLYAAIKEVGGEMIITADHGNVEQMMDNQTGQAHTAHTCELVPFAYVGRKATIKQGGVLSDVAPTLLSLMGIPVPVEMTGKNLIDLQ
ncbi:MAG: 2,3-bisphosphoglycerate-independent phosphoglycerate mutase, partial [Candidatus Competibacteraceae bacterium]|nr:2,3-bisphosphoglycerate-independent phosphoglycerate mutase [Candidatus Competibacteraceae bacterium]